MAGVYLHIPFCARKCGYCDFFSVQERRDDIPSFLALLHDEIRMASADGPEAVDTVYFGGGTPSLLEPRSVGELVAAIRGRFRLEPGAEITLEANPGTVDEDRLAAYRREGVNRISLGVQSFSDENLAALGRIHTAGQATQAVREARAAGFKNISLDLMFGIPGQTPAQFRDTLETAADLDPEHVSVYALTLHPGTPLWGSVRRRAVSIPDDDGFADLYDLACRILSRRGFEHYEVSNFAAPGMRCRHNEGYWTFRPYRGFGPSAHSFTGTERFWNISNLDGYRDAILEARLPVKGAERISPGRRRLEAVALGLRRKEGLSLEWVQEKESPIADLVRNGLVTIEDGCLRPTEKGFLLADAAAELLA
jgi:oxygen-independent coproporphyrinogen III oxidase